jgi:ribosomal protein S18 acetylase RimI-like enzyme
VTTVRGYAAAYLPRLVELSLAAWAPVFASVEQQLAGSGVFEAQHPDWRAGQQEAVESACATLHVRVAEVDDDVAGFVAVGRREDEPIGEIHMVAVDPRYQGRGIGRRLTEVALEWIAEQGFATAMVETAGDPGHAPARRLYESTGFTPFPIVRYFRTVEREAQHHHLRAQ